MAKFPPRPNNIGQTRTIRNIDRRQVRFTIKDEIFRRQKTSRHGKLVCIQKIRFEEDRRLEYRFAYYMIGVKEGARGRWVFAQYAPFIPPKDLRWLLQKARARHWRGF